MDHGWAGAYVEDARRPASRPREVNGWIMDVTHMRCVVPACQVGGFAQFLEWTVQGYEATLCWARMVHVRLGWVSHRGL